MAGENQSENKEIKIAMGRKAEGGNLSWPNPSGDVFSRGDLWLFKCFSTVSLGQVSEKRSQDEITNVPKPQCTPENVPDRTPADVRCHRGNTWPDQTVGTKAPTAGQRSWREQPDRQGYLPGTPSAWGGAAQWKPLISTSPDTPWGAKQHQQSCWLQK